MTSTCTIEIKHSSVKVEENKRKATFRNPKRLRYKISTIDNCIIKDGVRADYLVTEEDNASVIIELKGSNVSHACDQLFASAENNNVKDLIKGKIGFLIICSKYPRFDSFVAKAKQKTLQKYNAGLHVVQDKGEFDIQNVVKISGPY